MMVSPLKESSATDWDRSDAIAVLYLLSRIVRSWKPKAGRQENIRMLAWRKLVVRSHLRRTIQCVYPGAQQTAHAAVFLLLEDPCRNLLALLTLSLRMNPR